MEHILILWLESSITMLSTYSPHQLPIFTELKSAHKKRNIQVIHDIHNFNIISNLCYFLFRCFCSFLHFLLSSIFFMREKLSHSLVFLFACSSFSSNNFIIPQRWNHLGKWTGMWTGNYFLCISKKLPSIFSVFCSFSSLNESVLILSMNLLHISTPFHLLFQMFFNLTFHFEHKYSLWLFDINKLKSTFRFIFKE